jgi:CubicO group peptidase (beta-lactamase class C family)
MNEWQLAELLRDQVGRHGVPGASIAVLRNGTVTLACTGLADVCTGVPVTPQTRFSAGSLTKPMVATVIARLAGAGQLSLDDSVATHVPVLAGRAWARRATLRHLLANRSQIPLTQDLEFGFARRDDDGDAALAGLVAELTGPPSPAGAWSYSNAGWCVLGRVIESVTGGPWEDAMRRYLSDALAETTFRAGPDPSRASGHTTTPDGPVPVEQLRSRAYAPAGLTTGTTATDLLRLAATHLDDDRLTALRAVQAHVPIHGWLDDWCLGWARFDWPGGPVWGWDGLVTGERAVLRILPVQAAAVAFLSNGESGRALYRTVFTEVMAAEFGIQVPPLRLIPVPGAVADLTRYAGVYAWPDQRVEVTVEADHLRIKDADETLVAQPIDDRTFLVDAADPDNPTVTFANFDEAGRPHVLYLMLWALPRQAGQRTR